MLANQSLHLTGSPVRVPRQLSLIVKPRGDKNAIQRS